jgi:type VI protein secretion system component Hcp
MPGNAERSKKRKSSVKVRDMQWKQDSKAGKGAEAKGKVDVHDISITHGIDKASPALLGP